MRWQSLQLPASLSISDLERIDMLTGTRPDVVEQGDLAGNRVAGEKEVVGPVRVITDINQIHTFEQGEILVARMTDPTWYPLFAQASGIVTEVGGWLSHAAIVAREYDLPAIVGVTGVCKRLNTGDVIRMSLSGSVELLDDRRDADSPMRDQNRTGNALGYLSDQPAPYATSAFESAANDSEKRFMSPGEAAQHNVYQLTARKLFAYQQSTERRAMKERMGDRRSEPRNDANGVMQEDRREANRMANRQANARQIRKAG